jgi:hypothetical protein
VTGDELKKLEGLRMGKRKEAWSRSTKEANLLQPARRVHLTAGTGNLQGVGYSQEECPDSGLSPLERLSQGTLGEVCPKVYQRLTESFCPVAHTTHPSSCAIRRGRRWIALLRFETRYAALLMDCLAVAISFRRVNFYRFVTQWANW